MTSLSERLLAALDARDAELAAYEARLSRHKFNQTSTVDLARERRWVALGRAIRLGHWTTLGEWGGERVLVCGRCTYGDGVSFRQPCPDLRALAAALSVPLDPQETP